ncbi:MAG: hypothetical protein MJE12_27285 [Alphaproteobacteria bacterium]|nr:hypothetical protein [Alphaproteobacteria bacterium]
MVAVSGARTTPVGVPRIARMISVAVLKSKNPSPPGKSGVMRIRPSIDPSTTGSTFAVIPLNKLKGLTKAVTIENGTSPAPSSVGPSNNAAFTGMPGPLVAAPLAVRTSPSTPPGITGAAENEKSI